MNVGGTKSCSLLLARWGALICWKEFKKSKVRFISETQEVGIQNAPMKKLLPFYKFV